MEAGGAEEKPGARDGGGGQSVKIYNGQMDKSGLETRMGREISVSRGWARFPISFLELYLSSEFVAQAFLKF